MGNVTCTSTRLAIIAGGLLTAASVSVAGNAGSTLTNTVNRAPNAVSPQVLMELNAAKSVEEWAAIMLRETGEPGRLNTERGVDVECITCVDNEGEPNCNVAPNNINNGCTLNNDGSDPGPAGSGFGTITPGVPLCGKTSRFDVDGAGPLGLIRDIDWFQFTVPAGGRRVTVTARTEVPSFSLFARPGSGGLGPCDGDVILQAVPATGGTTACTDNVNTLDLPAGTYYYVFAHLGGTAGGTTPCTANVQYTATMVQAALPVGACCNLDNGTCIQATPIACEDANDGITRDYRGDGVDCASVTCFTVTCTPGGSTVAEGETTCPPTADSLNSGCSAGVSGNLFSPLSTGQTVCGEIAARDGTRDTDWYLWTNGATTRDGLLRIISETRQEGWIITAPVNGCAGTLTGFAAANANPGDPIVVNETAIDPNEAKYIYTSTATAVNVPVFNGVECGTDYSLFFDATAPVPAACCFTSGAMPTCQDNQTEAQCVALNGVYRGVVDSDGNPNTPPVPTTCATVTCCPDPCDPMATAEGGTSKAPVAEPLCGDGGNDFVNGGCAAEAGFEVFRDVSCGALICGTASFDRALGIRDTDWFTITVTAPTYVAALVEAQFENVVFILDPAAPTAEDPFGCRDTPTLSGFGDEPCALNIAGACLQPGTYYIVVVPSFDQAFPCAANARYNLEVFCCDNCTTTFTCSGGALSEPAGESDCNGEGGGNDGCSLETPALSDFQSVTGGQKVCGTTALTTDTEGTITRDPDWFLYNHPGGAQTFKLRSEFVADLFIFTPAGGNQGCDNNILEDGFILGCPTTGTATNDVTTETTFPAGQVQVLVAPSFFQDDFACGLKYEIEFPGAPPCNCPRNRGDANGDCRTNGADLSVLLGQFNQAVTPNTGGDFNNDGQVNGADLSILLGNFNCQ